MSAFLFQKSPFKLTIKLHRYTKQFATKTMFSKLRFITDSPASFPIEYEPNKPMRWDAFFK